MLPLFLAFAWMAGRWFDHALRDGTIGLALGFAIGITSLWLTRFEPGPAGPHYTPNRWLVLGLSAAWMETGGIAGIGGLLIGYALAHTWGVRARLPALARHAQACTECRPFADG